MTDSIWTSTLEEFRGRLATREPVPAGVSVAAVSASLAFSLLRKVLEITRARKDFAGDARTVEKMLAEAERESIKLARDADLDSAAFADYMASRKTPGEIAALRKAIEIPLDAARSAAAGLTLSNDAIAMTPAGILPDLYTARFLLAAAIQGILRSVESNARRLPDDDARSAVLAEVENLQKLAKNHQSW